jgi:hypothetical protein
MKFCLNSYWAPTPKKIRKIADSLLASAMLVSSFAFVNDYKTIAIVVMITTGVAKFVSNFFADDTEGPK